MRGYHANFAADLPLGCHIFENSVSGIFSTLV